ncbi:MAG: hypothetical protein ACFFD6_02570 [Candidatus Thorarchaeota archaeon]
MRSHEVALIILTITLGSLSFGKHTIFGTPTLDGTMYVNMVLAFRGEIGFHTIDAPFTYRPMTPFLASLLPFSPEFSISFLNTLFCVIMVLTIYWTCRELDIDDDSSFKASIAFAISWNILLYGSAVHIDTGLVMCWSLFILAAIREEKFVVLLSIGIVAVLFKEVALVMSLSIMPSSKIKGMIVLSVQTTIALAIRFIMALGTAWEGTFGYLWWIDISRNLNLAVLIESFFSLALIVPISYLGYINSKNYHLLQFIVPAFLVIIIGFLYGAFCGRFIWMFQVALAPLFAEGMKFISSYQTLDSVQMDS